MKALVAMYNRHLWCSQNVFIQYPSSSIGGDVSFDDSERQPSNVSNKSTLGRLKVQSESDRHAAQQRADARRRLEAERVNPQPEPDSKQDLHKRIQETDLF